MKYGKESVEDGIVTNLLKKWEEFKKKKINTTVTTDSTTNEYWKETYLKTSL